MWLLQDSDGKVIYLKLGKEIIVGRKKCDIVLDNDESISRVHASFIIRPKEKLQVNKPISECILREKGSKYGTYIINEHGKIKLTTEDYLLKNQDQIKFGLQKHIFTVKYVPMITVTSALDEGHKDQLNQILDKIDGIMLSHWIDDCTHLTVSQSAFTQKVVFALACAKPIVTVGYWEAVKQAVDNNENLPEYTKFTAQPGELLNRGKVSFLPNEERKLVFSGKVFIHFTESQFREFQKVIKYAGGKSIIYKANESKITIQNLCAKNVIVLQYPISDVTQNTLEVVPEYNQICKVLEERKLRMIPENEIGLAILHCSTEKFCNPRFRFSSFFKNTGETEVQKSRTLVIDTQDLMTLQENIEKLPKRSTGKHIIPETMDEFSPLKNGKTNMNGSNKCSVSNKHYIPESEDFSLQEKDSDVHLDASQTGSEKQKCGSSQKNRKIIPETLDFSPEYSKEANPVLSNDNPNIVRNIFSQSNIPESSSQTKILLPNPANPLIEGSDILKTKALKVTIESQSLRKQPECLTIDNREKTSEEKGRHIMHSTHERAVLRDGERISEKPREIIVDSQKLKTSGIQLSGENVEKKTHEVKGAMKNKPKVVMISYNDDPSDTVTPAPQKKALETFEPTSKRRKKHSDRDGHVDNQTITEVPLRNTSHCKVFKKAHVNLPERRIAFQELEVYDRTKDMY